MSDVKDYYQILEVDREASFETIKNNYKKLALVPIKLIEMAS